MNVKPLKHFRFGGSDYCEAMLCREDYHFVRCIKGDIMRDPRDGQAYKVVKVDNQTWMAENMRYEAGGSGCYDGMPENCSEYGRMYPWEAAQTVCPEGWHLPSDMEFVMLAESAGRWKPANEVDKLGFWAVSRPECEADSCDAVKPARMDVSNARIGDEVSLEEAPSLPVRCIKD